MTAHEPEPPDSQPGISRRALFAGVGAAGVAGIGGFVIGSVTSGDPAGTPGQTEPSGIAAPIPALGDHQAGIQRPPVPQQHCLVAVLDLDVATLEATLSALGARIVQVTDPSLPGVPPVPDGPGDLSVTVGLGARALAATRTPELAELVALPEFTGDADLAPGLRGGDLLLSINASNPAPLEAVLAHLLEAVDGAELRWSEFGFRGVPVDGVTRNSLGYWDGIIRPHTDAEFDTDVWISSGPLTGGSVCVVRRFRLDLDGFRRLAPAERDATIGRVESTGAPLSGGDRDDTVDLTAKTPSGDLLVPPHAHARAAHPTFTGSPLMLRRGYSYRASADELGHLFVSFQNDVATFTRTQLRLDEVDALMDFASPTATGAFAILPGWDATGSLGHTLF